MIEDWHSAACRMPLRTNYLPGKTGRTMLRWKLFRGSTVFGGAAPNKNIGGPMILMGTKDDEMRRPPNLWVRSWFPGLLLILFYHFVDLHSTLLHSLGRIEKLISCKKLVFHPIGLTFILETYFIFSILNLKKAPLVPIFFLIFFSSPFFLFFSSLRYRAFNFSVSNNVPTVAWTRKNFRKELDPFKRSPPLPMVYFKCLKTTFRRPYRPFYRPSITKSLSFL